MKININFKYIKKNIVFAIFLLKNPLALVNFHKAKMHQGGEGIGAIVFSKDRAIQLQALLESFYETKQGNCSICVIYAASNPEHKSSYMELINGFADRVEFYDENELIGFKDTLLYVLNKLKSKALFFLVDDIIFTEKVDYSKLAGLELSNVIFSLRMGKNLSFSYVVSKSQILPKIKLNLSGLLEWKWSDGVFEWGYPLSLDGHIYSKEEILVWLKYLDFKSPSSFEIALQKFYIFYKNRVGNCFEKSCIVNIPCNKVQNEVDNIHGSFHQDALLEKWNNGFKIDFKQFIGINNNSTHQEYIFDFIAK